MKLIQQTRVVTHGNETKTVDVLFDEKQIVKIAEHIDPAQASELIDGEGLVLLPGLIDVHVHLREPGYTHKETIKTGTAAAAHGGFTTIMAMPNVIPYPDNTETMKEYMKKIDEDALVHVIPYACITKSEASKELSDMKGLHDMGICAFSDDGVGVATSDMMKEAMETCKELNSIIVAHTEDMKYRKKEACMHEGIRNKELGLVGIPSACEYAQIERDLELVRETGCDYHICHMSAKESVELLRQAKAEGLPVTGEVTAHHLLLTEMDVDNTNHKMNPPLRSEEDRQSLIQGLLDGTIDLIANDHAPHSEEEKSKGMVKSPFGIVALETAFPLLYTHFVKEKKIFTLEQLVYFMSEASAKRFRFDKKGKVEEGYASDFILVDVDNVSKIDKNKFYSMGKNTPFDGISCTGFIQKTFVNGICVYDQKEGSLR